MKQKVYLIGTVILALCGVLTMVKTNQKPLTPVQAETNAEVEMPVAEVVEMPQASEQQLAAVAETPVVVASASAPTNWTLSLVGNPSLNAEQEFEKPTTNSVAERMTQAEAYAVQVVLEMSRRNGHDMTVQQ